MVKKLKQLFDYQKFARNPRLDAMLAQAEGRCAALSEDDLALVSAAGEEYSADVAFEGDVGPRQSTPNTVSGEGWP